MLFGTVGCPDVLLSGFTKDVLPKVHHGYKVAGRTHEDLWGLVGPDKPR